MGSPYALEDRGGALYEHWDVGVWFGPIVVRWGDIRAYCGLRFSMREG